MVFMKLLLKRLYDLFCRQPGLWLIYYFYRLRGKTWTDVYSDLLDWGHINRNIEDIDIGERERGILQLNYLKSHDLQSHNTLLDFGCGYGRAAIYFIEFLERGCYVGVDISRERLRIAQAVVTERKLWSKKPRFIRNSGCKLEELKGMKCDFIWANSVLGHMPWDDMVVLFQHLPSVMHKDSTAFMTGYFLSPDKKLGISRRLSATNYYYREDQLRELCLGSKLDYHIMEDFVEKMNFGDIEPGYDKLVRLKLKST